MSILETLRNKVAAVTDPHARRLRGEPLAELLRAKPTSWALETLRSDAAILRENADRDEATRAAVRARREAAAARAIDYGEKVPKFEPDAEAPEWRDTLARLDSLAAEMGLQWRGHIGQHLSDRRVCLVEHLQERFAAEGEPRELATLRADLGALVEAEMELRRTLTDLRKSYREYGGAAGPGSVKREQEIMSLAARADANGTEQHRLRRRMSAEFGVER